MTQKPRTSAAAAVTKARKSAAKARKRENSRSARPHRIARSASVVPSRPSKTAIILTALQRTEGATLNDLVAVTHWQPHSVRGFLSGTVRKRLGLTLDVQQVDGERRYRVNNPTAK